MRTLQIRQPDTANAPGESVLWEGVSAAELARSYYRGKPLYATYMEVMLTIGGTPLGRAPVTHLPLPRSLAAHATYCRTWYVESPGENIDVLVELP
jgi:hypothetical protein